VAVKVIKRTETQTGTRKVKKIRKNGYVPAVLYGQEMEATPLLLERSQVIRERITLGVHWNLMWMERLSGHR